MGINSADPDDRLEIPRQGYKDKPKQIETKEIAVKGKIMRAFETAKSVVRGGAIP
jgi:hypothetical protein